MLRIVADENIPYVTEAFGSLGRVACYPGREMAAPVAADADILLVRSVTKVGPELLGDSPVRFVGTATIGTDHVNLDYLRSRSIAFGSAAGSNSNSVAEYVVTALLELAQRGDGKLSGKTLGIIGVGNIGAKVEKKVRALGMRPVLNDPPLARQTGESRFVSLVEALASDFITCHVPLTRSGPDATYHLLDEQRLRRLKPTTVLLNTSRGAVVDNSALKACLTAETIGPVVLDVWENEPDIDPGLLERIAIGSPHIAGYSLDGKVNGTVMLHGAVCEMLGRTDRLRSEDLLPSPPVGRIDLDTTSGSDQQLLAQAMTTIYNIADDDRTLRRLVQEPAESRGKYFDQLRKDYHVRREAPNTLVKLTPAKPSLAEKLALLGFKTG